MHSTSFRTVSIGLRGGGGGDIVGRVVVARMSYCKREGEHVSLFVTQDDLNKPEVVSSLAENEEFGVILPNGEINWDCPCLGGIPHGPCGQQFKDAFSCFHYSTEEDKGSDCIPQFKNMQECFQEYPELFNDYNDEDEETAAAAGEGGGGGEGGNEKGEEGEGRKEGGGEGGEGRKEGEGEGGEGRKEGGGEGGEGRKEGGGEGGEGRKEGGGIESGREGDEKTPASSEDPDALTNHSPSSEAELQSR